MFHVIMNIFKSILTPFSSNVYDKQKFQNETLMYRVQGSIHQRLLDEYCNVFEKGSAGIRKGSEW